MELDETKIGRLDHKIEKLQILELVPGVEFLKTSAYSGTNGVCLEEFAPFGVIGIITPVTHSVPTLIGQRDQHDRGGQLDRRQPPPQRDATAPPSRCANTTRRSPRSSASTT